MGAVMEMDEETCRRVVRETVRETLENVGFDMRAPNKLQADMYYLRKLRHGSEDMMQLLRRSAITLSFTTALYLLWEAVKAVLQKS
jgi:hypothetical protein